MTAQRFDWREGRALQCLDALLGRRAGDALTEPLTLPELRPALLGYGAKVMARASVRWLVDGGGWRARQVLRDGARRSGRVWDAALGEGFGLRFGGASLDLWRLAMSTLPALAGRTELAGADRARLRARIRRAVPPGPTYSGDWIVGAMAAGASEDLRLSPEDLAIYQGLLRAVSPVVRLTHPDDAGDADALVASLAPLAASADARVMECAEDRVAAAWSARGSALLGAAFVRDLTAARWTALGAAMRAWCAVCDDARRMDLARAAAKAVAALLPMLFAQGPQALRARLSRAPGLRSVAERDALLGAVRSVVDVGAWLLRRRDVLAGERYGDDRYEEAQVFLRDVDGALGASRREVLELSRALSDQIG